MTDWPPTAAAPPPRPKSNVPKIAKLIGYVVAGLSALVAVTLVGDLNFGSAVLALLIAVVLLLACNPFGLRARVPWVGSQSRMKAVAGWAALILGGLLLASFVGTVTNVIPAVRAATEQRNAVATATAATRAQVGTATTQAGVAASTTTAVARSQSGTATAEAGATRTASTAEAGAISAASTATASAPTATRVPPSETPVPPTPTPRPAVGSTVSSGNWAYKVTRVTKPGKTLNTGNQFAQLNALGTWVVVYTTLANAGNQNYDINTWDFDLRVATPQTTYRVTDQFTAMNIWLERNGLQTLGKQVPPGVAFNTALLFDVAPDSSGMALHIIMGNMSIDLGI